MPSVTVTHTTKLKPRVSRAFLHSVKDDVLGKEYELSVAFVGNTEIRKLNGKFRGKAEPTDILSFSLSSTSGEIVLCMAEVAKQAPFFGRSTPNFLKFLFIHGLLHLKGYTHGSTMERAEEKIRKEFNI